MIDVSQLITRIQILLSGTNLEDSPHGRKLFEEYNNLCKSANSRLVECNALFEAQHNVEAYVALSRSPELLNLVEKLQFAELEAFLNLAQMYDWGIVEKINLSVYEKLKANRSSMLSSYALISEYSLISRSDKIEEKLVLLRKIIEIEPNNNEWFAVIREVESQYLRKIISEAQSAIIKEDYNRLGEIQDELANSSWHIEIPEVVINKINAVMHKNILSKMPEQMQNLLTEGDNAVKLHDIVALEDTVFLIDTLCSKHEYSPSSDIITGIQNLKNTLNIYKEKLKIQKELPEKLQILIIEGENAVKMQDVIALEDKMFLIDSLCLKNEYTPSDDLLVRIKKLKAVLDNNREQLKLEKEWKSVLDNINNSIEANEPIENIQELIKSAHKYPFEIPKESAKRINIYIKRIKAQKRHKKIVHLCKTLFLICFVGIIFTGVCWWYITKKQIKDFVSSTQAKMTEYKFDEIEDDILLFENKHKGLSFFSEFQDLSVSVSRMKKEINKKHKVFTENLNQYTKLFSEINLENSLSDAEQEIDKLEDQLEILSENAILDEDKNEFNRIKKAYIAKREEIKNKKNIEKEKKHKVFTDTLNEFNKTFSEIELEESLVNVRNKIAKMENLLKILSDYALSEEDKSKFNTIEQKFYSKKDEISFRQNLKIAANKYKLPTDILEKCESLYNDGEVKEALQLLKRSCEEQEKNRIINNLYSLIGNADSLNTLYKIINDNKKNDQPLYKTEEVKIMLDILEEDYKVLNDLITYQKNRKINLISQKYDMPYIHDIIKSEEIQLLKNTVDTIESDLSKFINICSNISYFSFLSNDNKKIEIYHRGNINGSPYTSLTTTMLDDSQISISYSKSSGFLIKQFDNDNKLINTWPGITLTEPLPPLTSYKLKAWQPPFMRTCRRIRDKVLTLTPSNLYTGTIKLLQEIQQDTDCLPYVKILMMQKLISAFSSINSSSFDLLKNLNSSLLKIIDSDEAASGNICDNNLNTTSKAFIEHLDLEDYRIMAEKFEIEQKLFEIVYQWKFQYLGVLFMEKNQDPQLFISNKMSIFETDVLCFDDKLSNFVYLGRLKNNKIDYVIDDISQYIGRILFTIKGNERLIDITKDNIELIKNNNIENVSWPLAWPENLLKK